MLFSTNGCHYAAETVHLNLCIGGNPLTGTFTNSEDPDEMPHNFLERIQNIISVLLFFQYEHQFSIAA